LARIDPLLLNVLPDAPHNRGRYGFEDLARISAADSRDVANPLLGARVLASEDLRRGSLLLWVCGVRSRLGVDCVSVAGPRVSCNCCGNHRNCRVHCALRDCRVDSEPLTYLLHSGSRDLLLY
jgi:hypothetical protein